MSLSKDYRGDKKSRKVERERWFAQEKKSNIIDIMLAMQEKEKDHYSDVAIKGMMMVMNLYSFSP